MTQQVQTLIFKDRRELFKAYLAFVKTGGLFLSFNDDINPNNVTPKQSVMVSVTMPNGEKLAIQGQVCWINTSINNPGYGIAFLDNPPMKHIKGVIEAEISEFGNKRDNVIAI